MNNAVIQNENNHRFEMAAGDDVAYLDYRWYKGDLALMHTHVPEQGRGKGLASALAHHALEYAQQQQVQILVFCPFVGKYLAEHPEYNSLINPKYRG